MTIAQVLAIYGLVVVVLGILVILQNRQMRSETRKIGLVLVWLTWVFVGSTVLGLISGRWGLSIAIAVLTAISGLVTNLLIWRNMGKT